MDKFDEAAREIFNDSRSLYDADLFAAALRQAHADGVADLLRDENVRERIAEALWQADAIRCTERPRREPWSEVSDEQKLAWFHSADAVLSVLKPATETKP